jgi:hypothetical protein
MSRGRARRPVPGSGTRAGALEVLLLLASAVLLAACPAAAVEAEAGDEEAVDYGAALSKSLLYFEAQRSGRLPHNQRVPWRGHSGLTDGLQQGVDLVGGYYDAGDHVKFGLPMAFTVTMLSWGAIDFADDVAAAGEWGHALEAIKWGTDYFVKAHTEPFVYWAEVHTACVFSFLGFLPPSILYLLLPRTLARRLGVRACVAPLHHTWIWSGWIGPS